jgi:hypothetical protein
LIAVQFRFSMKWLLVAMLYAAVAAVAFHRRPPAAATSP